MLSIRPRRLSSWEGMLMSKWPSLLQWEWFEIFMEDISGLFMAEIRLICLLKRPRLPADKLSNLIWSSWISFLKGKITWLERSPGLILFLQSSCNHSGCSIRNYWKSTLTWWPIKREYGNCLPLRPIMKLTDIRKFPLTTNPLPDGMVFDKIKINLFYKILQVEYENIRFSW